MSYYCVASVVSACDGQTAMTREKERGPNRKSAKAQQIAKNISPAGGVRPPISPKKYARKIFPGFAPAPTYSCHCTKRGWKPSPGREKERDGKILGFVASEAIRRGLTNGLFASHKENKVAVVEEEVSQRIYPFVHAADFNITPPPFSRKRNKNLAKKKVGAGGGETKA